MTEKILILEDDEATAELIRFYLEEDGFQTRIALKGEGFVDIVAEYQPDLITLDVRLPDANGFRIFQILQQDARTSGIPVVFVTVIEEVKEKVLEMGARGYLGKPFKEKNLKEIIKFILKKE